MLYITHLLPVTIILWGRDNSCILSLSLFFFPFFSLVVVRVYSWLSAQASLMAGLRGF